MRRYATDHKGASVSLKLPRITDRSRPGTVSPRLAGCMLAARSSRVTARSGQRVVSLLEGAAVGLARHLCGHAGEEPKHGWTLAYDGDGQVSEDACVADVTGLLHRADRHTLDAQSPDNGADTVDTMINSRLVKIRANASAQPIDTKIRTVPNG
jgi:hypothetical protein